MRPRSRRNATGTRSDSAPAVGASTMLSAVIGVSKNPAANAVSPSAVCAVSGTMKIKPEIADEVDERRKYRYARRCGS